MTSISATATCLVLWLILCYSIDAQVYNPRVFVRSYQGIDVPVGYDPPAGYTEMWYEQVWICSNLQVHLNLYLMSPADGAIRIIFHKCTFCNGAALKIIGWGSGGPFDMSSSSRPVHINISNNVFGNILFGAGIELVGALPSRSTVVIANNTFYQSVSYSTNNFQMAAILFTSLVLRYRSQLIVDTNEVQCALSTSVSPNTCLGVVFNGSLVLQVHSMARVFNNSFQLTAYEVQGVTISGLSATDSLLEISGASQFIVTSNNFTLTSDGNDKYGVLIAMENNMTISDFSSFEVVLNIFSLANATIYCSALDVGDNPSGTSSGTTLTVAAQSLLLFSTNTITNGNGRCSGVYLRSSILSAVLSGGSAVSLEDNDMSNIIPPPGPLGTSEMALLRNDVTSMAVCSTCVLWIGGNAVVLSTYGALRNFVMFGGILNGPVALTKNSNSGGNRFIYGSSLSILSNITAKCNVEDGLPLFTYNATYSDFTVNYAYDCETCAIEADCFAVNTESQRSDCGVVFCIPLAVLLQKHLSVQRHIAEFNKHEAAENKQSVGALRDEHVYQIGGIGDHVVGDKHAPLRDLVHRDDHRVAQEISNGHAENLLKVPHRAEGLHMSSPRHDPQTNGKGGNYDKTVNCRVYPRAVVCLEAHAHQTEALVIFAHQHPTREKTYAEAQEGQADAKKLVLDAHGVYLDARSTAHDGGAPAKRCELPPSSLGKPTGVLINSRGSPKLQNKKPQKH